MGKQFKGLVKEFLPDFETKISYESTNYQRCGNQISLLANPSYYALVEKDHPNVFRHHGLDAYQYLLETYYGGMMEESYIIYSNETIRFYKKFPYKEVKKQQNAQD